MPREKSNAATASRGAAAALFESYAQLTEQLLDNVTGVCLLNENLRSLGAQGGLKAPVVIPAIRIVIQKERRQHQAHSIEQSSKLQITVIPLEQADGRLLGVFCVQQQAERAGKKRVMRADAVAQKLKPVLDCLHRELAAARPMKAKVQLLAERTAELEWLFEITGKAHGRGDDQGILSEMLRAACDRLAASFGVLEVPEKQLRMKFGCAHTEMAALEGIWRHTGKPLLTWAERQNRPLVINGGTKGQTMPRCKILSVPVPRESGRSIGVLAFFRNEDAPDFAAHETFLARHLGRQAAALVEAQFDLMTGLYTRDGLEQAHGRVLEQGEWEAGSALYLDIDRLDVVNELHGFELGNELIVRVAELLTAPLLPAPALASRLSGDRFVVVLPGVEPDAAAQIAIALQASAARLVLGPPNSPVEVSISCGVAALIDMPQGLARALAAAEIACKRAKERGRNRVEIYSCNDTSIMRRNDDIAAIAQLRAAFKADRLLLYAQRIVPLQNPELPSSYEILMRLQDIDGALLPPGPMIVAAQRYQLLPTIDRRVMERTMQTLAPYWRTLFESKISFSINVTGQSICDEAFVNQLAESLTKAHLPRGAVSIEITEQAAMTNLARARETAKRLGSLGCRLALDDFGTGANSLSNLKSLQISRVKIDGSFVRDILTDRRSQSTVRAIVELAKGYGIDTVAEYVENEKIAEFVRKAGVDYAQGYAFGKPEPLTELLKNISKAESQKIHELFQTI